MPVETAPVAAVPAPAAVDPTPADAQKPPSAPPVEVIVKPSPVAATAPVREPRQPAAVAAPVESPKAATGGLPKVAPYALPLEAMNEVAAASGLQWVNSNADRVAQVQAAIAAEPKPIHVPREVQPVVLVDEGPLVLVETRKDLSDVKLPFESSTSAS